MDARSLVRRNQIPILGTPVLRQCSERQKQLTE
jgi:hypothetical protein